MRHLLRKTHIVFVFMFTLSLTAFAQQTVVQGKAVDGVTNENVPDVTVTIENSNIETQTDGLGEFSFDASRVIGEQVIVLYKQGYTTKRFPITINEGETLNLDVLSMDIDINEEQLQIGTISLSDNELDQDNENTAFNISGLLQASRDIFLNAAAYDFSATFFRPRGLDNQFGEVLINGLNMNKQFSGRPQWGNWGGLNDVQRNQEFSMGLSANEYSFCGPAGTTNIIMRASKYREGGRVSYATANRSYTGRVMGSYSSGLQSNGWAYTVLASRRFGDEGYIDGTFYDANSVFLAVEKKINDNHSLNLAAWYTPNRRGRSTAITEEVHNLKGREYNPLWGYQDGEIRNTRVRNIQEPIIMLNHYWDLSENTTLNTNVSYQFGEIANSRVENGGTTLVTTPDGQSTYLGGARNPDPSYYQNLPSYQLRFPNPSPADFQNAYLAQQEFINDGQFDFNALYEANRLSAATGGNSIYAIQEDVIDDTQIQANTILSSTLTDNITLNAGLNYRNLNSANYARISDLLGGTGYLDIDNFTEITANENTNSTDAAQSDLNNPNRIVGEGDRYKYNYEIDANVVGGFAQAQFKYNKVDFFVSTKLSQTSYQRNGLYRNGNFADTSFGESEKLDFSNYGAKAGLTYKITGRHLIDANGGYITNAPTIRSAFSNARQNNNTVTGLESEKITSADLSYIYRSPMIKARLTGFYTGFEDGTDIAFYFTEDVNNGEGAFVQEVLTNIERRNIGAELGIEAQVTPTIKLKAAASFGQYTFNNNPDVYYTSDDFNRVNTDDDPSNDNPNINSVGELRFGDGTAKLKDYHVASGPEQAYQIGFEYRDPNFWWFGVTTNYFDNAYIDVSTITRSDAFTTDIDGQPFNDYDPTEARALLQQEDFGDYILVNAVGGKSWKIDDYFVGFFITINNIFDEEYKTGGFQQSRTSNFRSLQEDVNRENGRVFGPRYFYGNGTTYYANVYVRF